jgi:ribonuclease D
VKEVVERTVVTRALYFVARRNLDPDGNVRALAELQRVVTRHRESKNANRHMLALADLYAAMAKEYVEARPPESLLFDPPAFQELVDSASQLYEAVANQDGTPEKLEAARRLEAFLAFTLRVDRDRFTP